MYKLGRRGMILQGRRGDISIRRNSFGIPCIRAGNFADLLYGLGWVHAHDRQVAMELTRLIGKGVAAEHLDPALLGVDKVMRRYNLWGDASSQARQLSGEALELLEAYCAGVNKRFAAGRPFEFKLIGHTPQPWTPEDCIIATKMMGIVDLTETQGWMEKFIVQMLQKGIPLAQIKELFFHLSEEPGEEYLQIISQLKLPEPCVPETIPWAEIPRFQCSNSWVVSGKKSVSGKPILCGDPHLDTSRLPAIWQEVILQADDFYFIGATVPGIPAPALGRTGDLAWSATYGNMDVVDYFIEEVKDGHYRKGERWLPFRVREETFRVKKGEAVKVRYYENEHGVLEQELQGDGYYLCFAWSAARDCGAESVEKMLQICRCRTVKEAMDCFAGLDFASFNWVIADRQGNIGYQMSGRCPVRAPGWSGLLPFPGWDERFDWRGYHDRKDNPSLYNPPEQFIASANQDVNEYAPMKVNNLSMAPYRSMRISQLLAARDDHTVETMKQMHYDIYSLQAERYMELLLPLLPDNEKGRLLKEWDLRYSSDSRAATLFENIYREIGKAVFGELNFGPEVLEYLVEETILFHDYYWNFDRVIFNENSAWYKGKKREEILKQAVERGLAADPEPYGAGRKIMLKNLFFGGRLPKFLGFDYGPVELIGGRATISISQIYKSNGREATFSPTYRFITDFQEECIHSVLAGGPSDRRFSRWYSSGIRDWVDGNYHTLKAGCD
ncbi:MAG TPA: penicillin acylase family protein [Bacillota bacterium]|nr:penicillin acylase family protein [Bacillota bacterium]